MTTLREALQDASTRHVALGHFNVSDLSGFHAVVRVGRSLNLPLMIGVSEGERELIGVKEIALLVRTARDEHGVSLYLNADHTHSLEKAKAAAAAGFDEIIFDASHKPFEQNIQETKQAVETLKSIRPDLVVEGEVGYIGASSEIVHGLLPSMVRGETHKRLDIERIRQIKQATGAFLTLHGGSGTADGDFVAAIQAGLTIIHINTELRVAWRRGLESSLTAHAHEVTPYKILPGAEQAMEDVVAQRLALFNSTGRS